MGTSGAPLGRAKEGTSGGPWRGPGSVILRVLHLARVKLPSIVAGKGLEPKVPLPHRGRWHPPRKGRLKNAQVREGARFAPSGQIRGKSAEVPESRTPVPRKQPALTSNAQFRLLDAPGQWARRLHFACKPQGALLQPTLAAKEIKFQNSRSDLPRVSSLSFASSSSTAQAMSAAWKGQ